MYFYPKNINKASGYGFNREKVFIFWQDDWGRDPESVRNGDYFESVRGTLK